MPASVSSAYKILTLPSNIGLPQNIFSCYLNDVPENKFCKRNDDLCRHQLWVHMAFSHNSFGMLIDVDENWCAFCASDMLSTSVPEQVTTQWPR
jgi:hypothetical protein